MWRYVFDGLFILTLWVGVATVSSRLDSIPPAHAAKACFPEEIVIEDDGRIVVGVSPVTTDDRRFASAVAARCYLP